MIALGDQVAGALVALACIHSAGEPFAIAPLRRDTGVHLDSRH
jgi:hypothetical protein